MEYLAVIAFAVIATVTPGPNNTMIMTSGLNYGVRRSLPHYFGIVIGFAAMVLAVGLGVAAVFETYPLLQIILKIVGISYLSYLAYKIASSPVGISTAKDGSPLTFLQAAAFQWVNPKAWALAVGATVTYTVTGESYFYQVALISLIFLVFGSPCIMLWLWFGSLLQNLLQNPKSVRLFNYSMAGLLLLSLLPVFFDLYTDLSI